MGECNNIKIMVACHKPDLTYHDEIYSPIHVGRTLSQYKAEMSWMLGDDNGDNISIKNQSYCELTALYWAWKNLKDVDIVGLCHYRRFFDFHHQCRTWETLKDFDEKSICSLNYNIPEDLIEKIKMGNVVVPRHITTLPLFLQYNNLHNSEDLRILKDIIHNNGDVKKIDAFNEVIYRNNKLHPFNMFIMRRDLFDDYCGWLFSILEKAESKIDISNYNSYQRRIFGFMGERLLNVYIKSRDLPVLEFPVMGFSATSLNKDKPGLFKHLARNCALNIINMLVKANT